MMAHHYVKHIPSRDHVTEVISFSSLSRCTYGENLKVIEKRSKRTGFLVKFYNFQPAAFYT